MKAQTVDVQFTIRDYRAADFERLWQIDQLCFPAGIAYSQMDLTGFIMRRNAITLVAEAQQVNSEEHGTPSDAPASPLSIMGLVIAQPIRKKTGRILTLDIVPEARRHGLASRLMQECEQRLRACGCTEAYLETAVNNDPALQLYCKLGYEVLRILPEYYSSHSLDAYLMGKRL